jgi:hypothetical protein
MNEYICLPPQYPAPSGTSRERLSIFIIGLHAPEEVLEFYIQRGIDNPHQDDIRFELTLR